MSKKPHNHHAPIKRVHKKNNHSLVRIQLYGFHTVTEALKNPKRKKHTLMVTPNALQRLHDERIPLDGVNIETVQAYAITKKLTPDAVHQGLLLECAPLHEECDIQDVIGEPLILALDQVTDPHNVGAITRTAAAFKVGGIILTHRHAPNETSVMAKSASGGLEHVPLVRVRNLGSALEECKKAGYTLIGLDSEAEENLYDMEIRPPVVLVLGAEGRGMRNKTMELCTHLARLDMPGEIKSLNVSNATSIALSEAYRKTRKVK